jgi:23S rRNA pseudouridine2604 synthase
VRVEGRDKNKPPEQIYILLNKPVGQNDLRTLVEYTDHLFPVDHLDPNVEGLILLTNDRLLSKRLTLPRYQYDQEFVVEVDRALTMQDIKKLQGANAKVRKIDRTRFAIILEHEPYQKIYNRCEAFGYQIVLVKRTRILTLKMPSTYPAGNWRYLTESEARQLKKAVGLTLNVGRKY